MIEKAVLFLRVLLFLALFSTQLSALDENGFLPRQPEDIGAYSLQPAHLLKSKAVLQDFELLYHDFPALKSAPGHIRRSFPLLFGLISETQTDLEGLLFSPIQDKDRLDAKTGLRHGYLAGRSGITNFLDGLIDLKGVGRATFSDNGHHGWFYYDQILETLYKPMPDNFEFGYKMAFQYFKKTVFALIQLRKEKRENYEDKRHTDLTTKKYQFEKKTIQEVMDFFQAGYESHDNHERIRLLNKLRSFDYFNGMMPLDRAIKEFIVQKVLQEIFDFVNSALGAEYYRTNQIYFILELPYKILSSGQPAAIIARQASLRNNDGYIEHSLKIPPSIANAGLGGWQHDAFGAVIDFELVEIVLDGLPPEFRYTSQEQAHHPLDQKMAELSTQWQQGNHRAVNQYLKKTLRSLRQWMKKNFEVPKKNEFYIEPQVMKDARNLIKNLESDFPSVNLEEIKETLNNLLKNKHTQGLSGLLLTKLNRHFPIFVSRFITQYLNETPSERWNIVMVINVLASSHISQPFIYYAEPIRTLLSIDPDPAYAEFIQELFSQKFFLDDELKEVTHEDLLDPRTRKERGVVEMMKIETLIALADMLNTVMAKTIYDSSAYLMVDKENEYWKSHLIVTSFLHTIDPTIMVSFFPFYLDHLKRGGLTQDIETVRSMLSNKQKIELDHFQMTCAQRLELLAQGAD